MQQQIAFTRGRTATPDSAFPARLRVVANAGPRETCTERARAALATVRLAFESHEPAELWRGLCSGQLRIAELATDELNSVALLEERGAGEAARYALNGRRLEILQRVLDGQSLNFVSLDLGLANSTVSTEFRHAATSLGLGERISELPILMAQLWFAAKPRSRIKARCCYLPLGSTQQRVISLPRADLTSMQRLPNAEAQVLGLLLNGCSHNAIAEVRGTSVRTVANQISSIFRKFGVSGRLELLTKFAREASAAASAYELS